jgi:hypothetical protein
VVTFENDYLTRCYIEDAGFLWPILVDSSRVTSNCFWVVLMGGFIEIESVSYGRDVAWMDGTTFTVFTG